MKTQVLELEVQQLHTLRSALLQRLQGSHTLLFIGDRFRIVGGKLTENFVFRGYAGITIPAGSRPLPVGHATGTQTFTRLTVGPYPDWNFFSSQATLFNDEEVLECAMCSGENRSSRS